MLKSCMDCKYECVRPYDSPCNGCFQTRDKQSWTSKKEECKIDKLDKPKNVIRFEELQDIELETYILKNEKYGDSFGISIEKYGIISALTRMSDKWNRIENLMMKSDIGTEDESLIDSLLDLSNYCRMTIMEIEKRGE